MKKGTAQKSVVVVIFITVTVLLVVSALVVLQNNTGFIPFLPSSKKAMQILPEKYSDSIIRIKVTGNGFEPEKVLVDLGSTVVWENASGVTVSINSAVHPTHTLHPFLNLGEVAPGSSVQVKMMDKGTFEYHNHYVPTQNGMIEVKGTLDN